MTNKAKIIDLVEEYLASEDDWTYTEFAKKHAVKTSTFRSWVRKYRSGKLHSEPEAPPPVIEEEQTERRETDHIVERFLEGTSDFSAFSAATYAEYGLTSRQMRDLYREYIKRFPDAAPLMEHEERPVPMIGEPVTWRLNPDRRWKMRERVRIGHREKRVIGRGMVSTDPFTLELEEALNRGIIVLVERK